MKGLFLQEKTNKHEYCLKKIQQNLPLPGVISSDNFWSVLRALVNAPKLSFGIFAVFILFYWKRKKIKQNNENNKNCEFPNENQFKKKFNQWIKSKKFNFLKY